MDRHQSIDVGYLTATFTGSAARKNARSKIHGVAPRMRADEASTASFRASNWCATRASDRGQGKSLNSKEISAAKARHESTKCQALQSLGHFCQHVRHSAVRISTKCLAYQPGLAPRNNIWLARPRFVYVAHPRLHPIVIAVFVVPAKLLLSRCGVIRYQQQRSIFVAFELPSSHPR